MSASMVIDKKMKVLEAELRELKDASVFARGPMAMQVVKTASEVLDLHSLQIIEHEKEIQGIVKRIEVLEVQINGK